MIIVICIIILIIVLEYFVKFESLPDYENDKYIYKDNDPENYWRFNKKTDKWKLKKK